MDRHRVPAKKLTPTEPVTMMGGMVTVRERPTLAFGQKSLVQNMRCWHPGFETRKGYTLCNEDAYALTSVPPQLYQFVSGREFNGAVQRTLIVAAYAAIWELQSSSNPPATGTSLGIINDANYGRGSNALSFCNVNDFMIMSGVSEVMHQIHPGYHQPISAFWLVKDTGAHDYLPEIGWDYTAAVTDELSDEVAVLDSLGDYATDYDAIYVMCKTPPGRFRFNFNKFNSTNPTVLEIYSWKANAWSKETISDGTASGGGDIAFGQSGYVTFSSPPETRWAANERPRYMFGEFGFWYRINLESGDDLDAEVELEYMDYGTSSMSDEPFSLQNIWNGVPTDITEVQVYDASATAYYTYAGDSIDISDSTSSDILYFASPYPLVGLYLEFPDGGGNATAVNPTVSYWDGSIWTGVTEKVDGTNSLQRSGWIIWNTPTTPGLVIDETRRNFQDNQNNMYWYKMALGATVDSDVVMAAYGMPRFDIKDFGTFGRVSAAWKGRACYTFNKFPRDVYVTEKNELCKLNGSDYGILEPGDGRMNATVAMVNFYNELMVFQEELGQDGGCVTLFEGYSPATWGKLILSTSIGTYSPRTVTVVDGAKASSTLRDVNVQTQVYFLSRQGVFMTDGKVVTCISDDIQNYFDERFSECIRRGYGTHHWVEYDSTEGLVKIGIVSGSSATRVNKWFCYDIATGDWYEDVYTHQLGEFKNIEADSGNATMVQVGMIPSSSNGSSWYLCLMNQGTNDNNNAIDAKMTWEFSHGPYLIDFEEILTRVKVQGTSSKTYTWTLEENDVQLDTGTGQMIAEVANETVRRNRHQLKAKNTPWITFTIQANTLDVPIYLYDMAILSTVQENK